jgi:hypothetical protein
MYGTMKVLPVSNYDPIVALSQMFYYCLWKKRVMWRNCVSGCELIRKPTWNIHFINHYIVV